MRSLYEEISRTPAGSLRTVSRSILSPWNAQVQEQQMDRTHSRGEAVCSACETRNHQVYLPIEIQKMLEDAGRIRIQLL